MYAIVEIAGQQFKVEKDKYIYTHRLPAQEGESLTFDQVYLVDNDGAITIGKPTIVGATIGAKVLQHVRGEKLIIFKKKRRKTYQKATGHRQDLTKVIIESINF